MAPEAIGRAVRDRGRDSTLVKARAFRWRWVLEGGQFASVAEIAAAETINQSYLCGVLRLTLLAPDIVGAVLDGRRPELSVPKPTAPSDRERQRAIM